MTRLFYIAMCLTLVLSACVLSKSSIKADGSVVVEVASFSTFYVDGSLYTLEALEFALRHLGHDRSFKVLKIYVPTAILRAKNFSCEDLRRIALAPDKPWQFYEQTSESIEMAKPFDCDIAVLAGAVDASSAIAKPFCALERL